MTSTFAGRSQICRIRHAGNQTIRFGTSTTLPARLVPLNDVIFGAVLRAHVRVGDKWKGVVPLVGSEERRYRVVTGPPEPSACDPEARPYLRDCSGTKPLAQGTGTFVDTRPPKARAQKVAMRVPAGTGLQRNFPECPIIIFNLKNDWLYPLFTYNDWRPLAGGSPLSARARRLTARGMSSTCYENGYPGRIDGTPCGNPHVAKISIDWRVTLSR